MLSAQVIDLTECENDEVQPVNTGQSIRNALGDKNRSYHSEFWAKQASGPQRHGPRRMRNLARPRLGDDCPFLELPPEVRNRIYEHALGGHNLHMFTWNLSTGEGQVGHRHKVMWKPTGVCFNGHRRTDVEGRARWRLQYVICQCPNSDDEEYRKSCEMPAKYDYDAQVDPYQERHEDCFDVEVLKYATVGMRKLLATPRLAIGLLRTCKQVYNEAALVPYYDNTFSFARGSDLDFFVNHVLQDKQRAALQHVTYAIHLSSRGRKGSEAAATFLKHHFCDQRLLGEIQPKTIDMLSGLKVLSIAVDGDRFMYGYNVETTLERATLRVLRKDLKVEVALLQEDEWSSDFSELRRRAEELEFGLVRSIEEVPSHREAREQLEVAQMQAAQLEHAGDACSRVSSTLA